MLLHSSRISFGGVELFLLSQSCGEWKMIPGHKNTLVWVQWVGWSAVMQRGAWGREESDWGSVGRLWADRAPGQGKAAQHKPRSVYSWEDTVRAPLGEEGIQELLIDRLSITIICSSAHHHGHQLIQSLGHWCHQENSTCSTFLLCNPHVVTIFFFFNI